MGVMGQQPLVSVVDDDESVRESLSDQIGFYGGLLNGNPPLGHLRFSS